ncbi:hypothetical protein KY285_031938 [Solanum tuberosum]|nr:hypothetical protein KY285_031938 [Solanum tuberosum]
MEDDIVELGSPSQNKRKRTNEVKFKMKPLKIDNEVGSNMKSTIRYTFIAPGAIGKGWGRGLKSLGEKGNTPSKSLLPQSSDLVKKYIKEIETSSTEKDRGQGLKKSTIFTSQGMQTIYKNSMVPEKENKQINLSFPTSAIKVEKCAQEVETRKIFQTCSMEKDRGQGLKRSTIFTSQGMQTIYKNSTVEKCTQEVETMRPAAIRKGLEKRSGSLSSPLGISESEVGSFNKSVVCANQHMQTPSKSTKPSSTSSSQEIKKMKNIILEKEDMQTNVSFSPSIIQVMKHSQTTEKGSSNPTKVKKVRGSNMCKEVASLEIGQKLKVTFYNNRTVGANSNLFSRHLGKIIRDRNICPLGVSSWHDIKQEKLNHMWVAVEHKFESVDMNDHRDHILGWMNELWNKWRGHLHAKYVKDKPIQQSLKNVPRGFAFPLGTYPFCQERSPIWRVYPIRNCISFSMARSRRNATNRAKLKMLHHIGSKPIREIIYQKGGKDGNPPDLATIFFETRGGVKAKDLKGGTSSKAELLSALRSTREDIKSLNEENKSLNEENKSLKDRLSTIEDKMKEIMNMKEFFISQQSHVPPTTSSVSIE